MGRHLVDWRKPYRARMRETGETFRQAWSAINGRPFGTKPERPTEPFQGPRLTVFLGPAPSKERRRRDGKCWKRGAFREHNEGKKPHTFTLGCCNPDGHEGGHYNGDPTDPLWWPA